MVNTVAQAAELIAATGSPGVRMLADTYHMNIEEDDPCAALRAAGDLLGAVHLSDSNRHQPGTGHVPFGAIVATLREVGFDGVLSRRVPAARRARAGRARLRALPARPARADYAERVYAGVLGKIIGVYLGRPFEGWTYERIEERLGEITGYVTGHPASSRPSAATRWSSPTTTSPAPSPSCARSRTTATGRHARADRPDLAQLHHRGAHDPLVGRPRQLDRAHRLPAPEGRHPRAGQRLDRAQRQGAGRADRRADLHRRLGDGLPGRPRARRRPRPPRRQRQPRRRGDLRRAGHRGDGGAGVRRAGPRTRCSTPAPSLIPRDCVIARLIDDIRELARRRRRLAPHARADRGALRLRPLPRQLPHGPQPRPDHPRPALRRRRLRPLADDRQHRRLGHRLQLRQRRLPARHPGRPRRRSAPRLARPGRRPHVPLDRRRRAGDHRRRDRDGPRRQRRPRAGRRAAVAAAALPLLVPRLGPGLRRRARRTARWRSTESP